MASVALHVARWAERSLMAHDPPLTVAQFLTLQALARGVEAPSELARRAGVTDAAVSQLLRDLEHTGLVQRELSPVDRRRHALQLSDAGRAAYESAAARLAAGVGALLGSLPAPDTRQLADLLERVSAMIEGVPPPRRPPGPPAHRPPKSPGVGHP